MVPALRAAWLVAVIGCGGSTAALDAPRADSADAKPGRALEDRPDEVSGPMLHVIYAVPSDAGERGLDLDGSIARSVTAFNGWLGAQTGGPRLRVDLAGGALDITFVRLSRTRSAYLGDGVFLRDALERELGSLGHLAPAKLYAVYFDGDSGTSCGGGAWPPELAGRVGALFLQGTPPGAPACDTNVLGGPQAPQYLEYAMLHELVHTIGGVGACAPNHTLRGHTSDSPTDLMYAGTQPWTPSELDVGRDDYFGTGRADCFDLARSALLDPMPANPVLPPGW